MFYMYYDDSGNVLSVTNIIDNSFGPNYFEVDLKTYEEFSNLTKQFFDYIVIDNIKIKGKKQIVPRDLDLSLDITQPKGIIAKHPTAENAIIINQDLSNGSWTITNTMDSELCSLFAQSDNTIKTYYVVDPTNRFILLDTLSVDLKLVVLHNELKLKSYNKEVSKMSVSLLCNSHHVKHIHNVQE